MHLINRGNSTHPLTPFTAFPTLETPPPEILLKIIESLGQEVYDRSALSLVSKRWYHYVVAVDKAITQKVLTKLLDGVFEEPESWKDLKARLRSSFNQSNPETRKGIVQARNAHLKELALELFNNPALASKISEFSYLAARRKKTFADRCGMNFSLYLHSLHFLKKRPQQRLFLSTAFADLTTANRLDEALALFRKCGPEISKPDELGLPLLIRGLVVASRIHEAVEVLLRAPPTEQDKLASLEKNSHYTRRLVSGFGSSYIDRTEDLDLLFRKTADEKPDEHFMELIDKLE